FTESGDFVFLEGKGANPNSLTDAQHAVDKIAQERGGTFEVLEIGGKPPGGARVRSLAFTKGFKGSLKPGAFQHVSGRLGGNPGTTVTNSMGVDTWRASMDAKHPSVDPTST